MISVMRIHVIDIFSFLFDFFSFWCLFTFIDEAEPEDSEEPFVAPAGLEIPPDVELVSSGVTAAF